jgi:hypothetical protein
MMRDAEELPVILAELEDAWTIVEQGLYAMIFSLLANLALTWFEGKSSCQRSEYLSNICKSSVVPLKTLRN